MLRSCSYCHKSCRALCSQAARLKQLFNSLVWYKCTLKMLRNLVPFIRYQSRLEAFFMNLSCLYEKHISATGGIENSQQSQSTGQIVRCRKRQRPPNSVDEAHLFSRRHQRSSSKFFTRSKRFVRWIRHRHSHICRVKCKIGSHGREGR